MARSRNPLLVASLVGLASTAVILLASRYYAKAPERGETEGGSPHDRPPGQPGPGMPAPGMPGPGMPGPGMPPPGGTQPLPMMHPPVNATGMPEGVPPGMPPAGGSATNALLNTYARMMHQARIPGCDVPPCPDPLIDTDTTDAMYGTADQLEKLGRNAEALTLRQRANRFVLLQKKPDTGPFKPEYCNLGQLPMAVQAHYDALLRTTNPIDIPQILAFADELGQCAPLQFAPRNALLIHARDLAISAQV